MGTQDLDMIMVMIIVLVRDELYPLLMKVPFAKDNPFISISTYFLSNSYTLATVYREKSSCCS